jgi:hypothetical protein
VQYQLSYFVSAMTMFGVDVRKAVVLLVTIIKEIINKENNAKTNAEKLRFFLSKCIMTMFAKLVNSTLGLIRLDIDLFKRLFFLSFQHINKHTIWAS